MRGGQSRHLRFAVLLCCVATGPFCRASAEDLSIDALVGKVGNARSEEERLEYLGRLANRPDLTEALAADVERMAGVVRHWAEGPIADFSAGAIIRRGDYSFGMAPDSPLYPLTYSYRGRVLTWALLQIGGSRDDWSEAQQLLEKAHNAYPEDPIVGMYLGEPIPAPAGYPAVANAPEWAVHQRAATERLTDIIYWWIDHRLREDGNYGGGWEDDCEMWRWWAPILLGFEDPKVNAAQATFSQALLTQPHMSRGYTTRLYDVEHTAEGTADTLTPMMHLEPDNALWQERALRLAELFETLWTGVNERGQLQFKSTYFNGEQVSDRPQWACDTVYHPRAVQPALLLWQRTGDERLGTLFSRWMDTWVDAAARAERGKPAGILPSAIHWPDGTVGGVGRDWWDPENHRPRGYQFPSAMPIMTHTLLLTWHMTGDERYLDPIRSMADALLRYVEAPVARPEPGSEAWCAQRLGGLLGVLGKYRWLTGDDEFDALLSRRADPYLDYRLHGDPARMAAALAKSAEALSVNFEGYTSEVRYTDRVLKFPRVSRYAKKCRKTRDYYASPDPELLYSTLTGDPGTVLYFPLNAVRWLTPPRDIAALVTQASREDFKATLFHFGETERAMAAEFYSLSPGEYVLTLGSDPESKDGHPPTSHVFQAKGRRTRVEFTLPTRQACVLTVARHERDN